MEQTNILSKVLNYFQKEKKAMALPPSSLNLFSGYNLMGDLQKTGLPKPGKISFDHLRKIAKYDYLIRICIGVIKKEVSQADWAIVPKKGVDEVDEKQVEKAEMLFTKVNNNGENLRVLLDRILEDLLIYDAGVIEKVFNAKGALMELNSVDASTIRPVYNLYGDLDPNKAYVQVVNNKVVAEFKASEIIYMMQNPQNSLDSFGYGLSPIESILLAVQASLNADVYNARRFSEDNVPPGMLDLGDMSKQEADNLIALWNATVINNTQKIKFVYGKGTSKKYVPFVQNHKDMQFVEYIDWLSRIKLSIYGLSTIDANITQDVNRATSETQNSISQSRGIRSVKRLIEEYINREILLPMGLIDVQFKFEETQNVYQKKLQAEVDQIYIMTGVLDPNDVARREGFTIMDEEQGIEDYNDTLEPDPRDGLTEEEEDKTMEGDNKASKSFKKKQFKPLYK